MLDFSQLPCPQPVVACRKFLQENTVDTLQILVGNAPAVENVSRYLAQQGFSVQSEPQGENFVLMAVKSDVETAFAPSAPEAVSTSAQDANVSGAQAEKILVFITTETLGRGDDELGSKLMTTFLQTLPEMGEDLWRVVLLNGGVKLAANQGAPLQHLQALEKAGVHVMVCGACLMHYELVEQKAVGETSNMLDIVTSLQLASKVIRP